MKIFRAFLSSILVLASFFLILALLIPSDLLLERSILIDAPPKSILPQITSLKQRFSWYSWSEIDPQMQMSFLGDEGRPGSISRWVGNPAVGTGEEEILEIRGNHLVRSQLRYNSPVERTAEIQLRLSPKGPQTMVTWTYRGDLPFPFNVVGIFVDMESAIGTEYEKGLVRLKEICEMS